jgi:virginiamycin B lyase
MKRNQSRALYAVVAVVLSAGLLSSRAAAQSPLEGAAPDAAPCNTQNRLKICSLPGPSGSAGSYGIGTGLGSLWVTSPALNDVCSFSPKGVATCYPIPLADAKPEGIALGPDKRLWFTEWNTTSVGAMTAKGVITEYTLGYTYATVIVPSGNDLWISTDYDGVCKISTKGALTCYTLPGGQNDAQPTGLALGPDGNVWFIEWNGVCSIGGGSYSSIGKITPDGVVTTYDVGLHGNSVYGIAAGPDGRIWFTDPGGCEGYTSRIGAIDTDGSSYTYYSAGLPAQVGTIVNGGDGNLYYGSYTANQMGRITTAGVSTVWTIPAISDPPFVVDDMGVGPDKNIWFVDSTGNYVGVLYLN